MLNGLFAIYIVGFFGMNIITWIIYAGRMGSVSDEKHLKYQACIGSLISPVWPIGIPYLLFRFIRKYKQEEKKKELQQCICPECERKFLQE